jgi:hypothetical protein
MFISEPFPFEASLDASSEFELAGYRVLLAIALMLLVITLAAATSTSVRRRASAHTASSQMVRHTPLQQRR